MLTERALGVLLAVVAAAAAVLSFSALHDLAIRCGFLWWSAPLLPLVVDAGAAAGSVAWLSRTGPARIYGRALALVLLAATVAGNGFGHALAAYGAAPAWWAVVIVSATPPAVLGAVVHLAMLAGRTDPAPTVQGQEGEPATAGPDVADDAPPEREGLDDAGERQLIADLATAARSGQALPSSNDLISRWRIGRGRANRILTDAGAAAAELRAVG